MTQPLWTAVDNYVDSSLSLSDDVLSGAIAANAEGGLPSIDVTASQGKLLHLLARAMGAKRVLEIGTLGGYSTIWLARAVGENGKVVTLELDAHHAEIAQRNLDNAGIASRVDLRVGPAAKTLEALIAEASQPFDFIFIDADKASYPDYMQVSLKLSRPGTLIIADNVVRDGQVIDPNDPDPNIQGVRRFTDLVATEPRLSATVLQTVGSKGYDGFAIAIVN
jgi:predicted O-methyltransferase YrrM